MLSSGHRKRGSADDRLDAVFHALGDRTRRALLARLATRPARVTELARPFDMSLPAVSRHIRVLEAAGLIARSVDGRASGVIQGDRHHHSGQHDRIADEQHRH